MRNLVRRLVGVGWLLWSVICWCASGSGELLTKETLDGVIHGDGSSCLGTARTQFGENPAMLGFSLQLGLLHAEIHLGQMMDGVVAIRVAALLLAQIQCLICCHLLALDLGFWAGLRMGVGSDENPIWG
ncbi:hypothetical protein ACLOJK_006462 [Asimina triloba]